MAVVLATIASEVVAQMNLAVTYTATVTDPRAYSQQVTDAVLNADGMVIEAILSNPSNGQRAAFIISTTVAHAGALPARIGPIDSVVIGGKGAVPWDISEIENERTNRLTLTSINPHFAIEGNVLFHNQGATAATVRYVSYAKSGACQSPDEYGGVVLCGALMLMFSIEGENDSTASMYGQQFQAMLQAIRNGQAPGAFTGQQ